MKPAGRTNHKLDRLKKEAKADFVKGEKTRAREAVGRERVLVHADREPLWLRLALDTIARHRAAGEPLDRVLHTQLKEEHAGQRERKETTDVVFSWARQRAPLESVFDEAIKKYGGTPPRRRDRDRAAVLLARLAAGDDVAPALWTSMPEPLCDVIDDAATRGASILAGRAAFPAWLVARIEAAHGAHAATLLEALSAPASLSLAVDVRSLSVDAAQSALQDIGAVSRPSPVVDGALRVTGRASLSKLAPRVARHLWPMDDGSQLVAHALGTKPGDLVLDLCAGGGGKTRALAATGARVVASDIHAGRMAAARGRVPDVAFCVVADGRMAPFPDASFDRVLVDAPCSGTGTLRRAPDLAARLTPEDVTGFVQLQRALLARAAMLVKPGGVIIYATCSVLATTPSLEPTPLSALWGKHARVGIDDDAATARLLPSLHGTDGFFVAALRKRA